MITKKQIGTYLLIIALIVWSVFSGIRLMEVSERAKSLEASHRILEQDFLNEQEDIKKSFDSIGQEIHYLNEHNANLEFEIEALRKTKADRKSKKDEKDTDIAGIHNSDSLYREIARHYQR